MTPFLTDQDSPRQHTEQIRRVNAFREYNPTEPAMGGRGTCERSDVNAPPEVLETENPTEKPN